MRERVHRSEHNVMPLSKSSALTHDRCFSADSRMPAKSCDHARSHKTMCVYTS
jgi:hypothetical protein